jgi:hypothetical protein
MSNHHKIFFLVNHYTPCCFMASVYVDQCHQIYEDSLCYVIPCITSQKIFDGFVLSFISFVILFCHSLLIQHELSSFTQNINILFFSYFVYENRPSVPSLLTRFYFVICVWRTKMNMSLCRVTSCYVMLRHVTSCSLKPWDEN